jgi:outer membrane protein assembly factor BamB
VVGSSIGDGTKMDLVTIAYDAATGEEIWARRYDGPAHGIDQGAAVAIDETNDAVVVTGGSERVRASGIFDVITIAYDAASGAPRYERRFSKRPSSSEVGGDVAAANGMAVVLVNGTVHGHLLAYDAEGDVMWQRWATRRNVSSLVDVGPMPTVCTSSEAPSSRSQDRPSTSPPPT